MHQIILFIVDSLVSYSECQLYLSFFYVALILTFGFTFHGHVLLGTVENKPLVLALIKRKLHFGLPFIVTILQDRKKKNY